MTTTPSPTDTVDNILEIKGLRTHFTTGEGVVKAVDGVTLNLRRGTSLAIVGESGCGKSITARSVLQIVDSPGRIVSGEILFHKQHDDGHRETIDIAALGPKSRQMRALRWQDIAMIFQEPMSSLSPVHTIGNQIREAVMTHARVTKDEAHQRAVDHLRMVGIPNPERAVDRYPFQLSGGMRQRAMIAMALVGRPSILIADEPTTALDVTTQAQVLDLIRELQRDMGMSLIMITHDLGVVAEIADDVAVMYLGTVVETGTVTDIFDRARHPYTRALLRSIPATGTSREAERLYTIKGTVPNPYQRPPACPYHTRCEFAMSGLCDRLEPPTVALGEHRSARCLLFTRAGLERRKQDVTTAQGGRS